MGITTLVVFKSFSLEATEKDKSDLFTVMLFRVAEFGSLSSGSKMAMKILVNRVLGISASNASFLRVIANLQI